MSKEGTESRVRRTLFPIEMRIHVPRNRDLCPNCAQRSGQRSIAVKVERRFLDGDESQQARSKGGNPVTRRLLNLIRFVYPEEMADESSTADSPRLRPAQNRTRNRTLFPIEPLIFLLRKHERCFNLLHKVRYPSGLRGESAKLVFMGSNPIRT